MTTKRFVVLHVGLCCLCLIQTYKGSKVQVLKTTESLEFYFGNIMPKKTPAPNETNIPVVQQFSFEWSDLVSSIIVS